MAQVLAERGVGVAEAHALRVGGAADHEAACVFHHDGYDAAELDRHVVYVVPRVNPDGAEAMFGNVLSHRTTNRRPIDDDNDGRTDEDPPEDLNGDGLVDLRQYKVGDLTPGQFFDDLRDDVEQRHAKLVVIDSYTGYLNLMPEEGQLITKLHELLRYLSSRGVLTLMTVNLHGLFGRGSDVPTSYLADTIVLMRHFEAMGRIRRCISVLKKRHGNHEQSIREVQVGEGGLQVGPPLEKFSGLLSGTPTYHGQHQSLLENDGDPDAEQA